VLSSSIDSIVSLVATAINNLQMITVGDLVIHDNQKGKRCGQNIVCYNIGDLEVTLSKRESAM
jgi:hypothetical protein